MSGDKMIFPLTWKEYENDYGFTDKEQVYTNGIRLIPSFRVEQWLEHIEESRPKGKWEDFSCSLCGFTPLIKPMAIDTTKGLITCIYKYCPSCGAEMECEE